MSPFHARYDLCLDSNLPFQIIKLSAKVWNSVTIREELAKLASDAQLNAEVLVRSVKTRWNTVAHVLERALDMHEVLDALCNEPQFNKRTGARLRRFILTENEWKLIEQLFRLLDVSPVSVTPTAVLPTDTFI